MLIDSWIDSIFDTASPCGACGRVIKSMMINKIISPLLGSLGLYDV